MKVFIFCCVLSVYNAEITQKVYVNPVKFSKNFLPKINVKNLLNCGTAFLL